MDRIINVILTIDKVHKAPQRALDCSLRFNHVYGPKCPTLFAKSKGGIYISTSLPDVLFRNQFDIPLRAVVDVSKGQTDTPYHGEYQTITIQSMRHQVF